MRFSKKILIFSFLFLVLYTLVTLYLIYQNIPEPSTLTTCVFTFFGTEICMSAFIKVAKIKKEQGGML